ncbi:hypothetical protein [Labedella endophytica]|jgi:hypothetical protein|uniref:Major facilitator superfamily (MFS) profile domain-containing protein n=1 Tax=Labedella endophytica TaxID=1523160 RepID=A0A433JVC6_9MICO|nr:hypothetical protein [Labedella endophytica]RUR03122.1 hypothetical protein ELQ94_00750 [Labedella endophytica]
MTPDPRPTAGATAARVMAAMIGGLAAALFLATAWVALRSRFGPPEVDMHGYGLIFGAVVAVMAGLVAALVLPLALPRGRRTTASLASLSLFVLSAIGLAAAVLTA